RASNKDTSRPDPIARFMHQVRRAQPCGIAGAIGSRSGSPMNPETKDPNPMPRTQAAAPSLPRVRAQGKVLVAGGETLTVRGVTYGTFRPDAAGHEFPPPEAVERDFALMARHGINAVRTYTAPPRWLLDQAQRHGLRVLVGLGAERQVGFLCEGR